MNQQDAVKQPLPHEGSVGYAWIPLPEAIQRNGELFAYAVLTIRVGQNLELKQCGPSFPCRTEEEAKMLFEFLVANKPNVARFKIYRDVCSDKKRRREAEDLQALLWHLEDFVELDEVTFGEPPDEPDFIFVIRGKQIGVELTVLNPKIFKTGGYVQKGKFKKWKAETKPTIAPQKFHWGSYTLRESLSALRVQVDGKCDKAKRQSGFPERWLLLHVAKGSPFSQILGGKHQTVPGKENEVADFVAKSMHGAYSVCKESRPFDYVIFFMQDDFLAFPTNSGNPRKLPVPSEETLKRGAEASDRFLDWQKDSSSVTKAA